MTHKKLLCQGVETESYWWERLAEACIHLALPAWHAEAFTALQWANSLLMYLSSSGSSFTVQEAGAGSPTGKRAEPDFSKQLETPDCRKQSRAFSEGKSTPPLLFAPLAGESLQIKALSSTGSPSLVSRSKWHPFPYIVHYFWSESPMGPGQKYCTIKGIGCHLGREPCVWIHGAVYITVPGSLLLFANRSYMSSPLLLQYAGVLLRYQPLKPALPPHSHATFLFKFSSQVKWYCLFNHSLFACFLPLFGLVI
jgi:hypothetical protein